MSTLLSREGVRSSRDQRWPPLPEKGGEQAADTDRDQYRERRVRTHETEIRAREVVRPQHSGAEHERQAGQYCSACRPLQDTDDDRAEKAHEHQAGDDQRSTSAEMDEGAGVVAQDEDGTGIPRAEGVVTGPFRNLLGDLDIGHLVHHPHHVREEDEERCSRKGAVAAVHSAARAEVLQLCEHKYYDTINTTYCQSTYCADIILQL